MLPKNSGGSSKFPGGHKAFHRTAQTAFVRVVTPVAEFLSPQQIKSYFSRAAAKLRQSESCDDADECDVQAVEEEDVYSSVRTHIIQECQLVHPVMYDTYNLCEMWNKGN